MSFPERLNESQRHLVGAGLVGPHAQILANLALSAQHCVQLARCKRSVAHQIETSKNAYRALGLRGYGRVDLRVKPDGEIYVIEVNPNPAIARDDDFMLGAAKVGLDYDTVIARILNLA